MGLFVLLLYIGWFVTRHYACEHNVYTVKREHVDNMKFTFHPGHVWSRKLLRMFFSRPASCILWPCGQT